MKKETCMFCGREDSIENLLIQTSFIQGNEQWVHSCCKAKIKKEEERVYS